jgi:GNAT superfamily N-acetyltransferase
MDYEIRRLGADDETSGFSCGNIELDRFFQRYAALNQFRHHIGTTYVAARGREIVGFVTVTPSEIQPAQLPQGRSKLPKYPIPVLRLARLGVHLDHQGKGIGLAILRFTFQLALRMSDDLGCSGVVVDAKPEAGKFYEQYGFVSIRVVSGSLGDRPQSHPMFLEIGTIRTAAARP